MQTVFIQMVVPVAVSVCIKCYTVPEELVFCAMCNLKVLISRFSWKVCKPLYAESPDRLLSSFAMLKTIRVRDLEDYFPSSFWYNFILWSSVLLFRGPFPKNMSESLTSKMNCLHLRTVIHRYKLLKHPTIVTHCHSLSLSLTVIH